MDLQEHVWVKFYKAIFYFHRASFAKQWDETDYTAFKEAYGVKTCSFCQEQIPAMSIEDHRKICCYLRSCGDEKHGKTQV